MASPVNEQQQQQQQQIRAGTQESKPSLTCAKERQASPKRKSSEAATATENGEGKKKRRKVNHACVYCRRSHMTCDLERPCARCKKRDIGHLCHDEPREPPKRTKSEMSTADIAPAPMDTPDGQQSIPASNGVAQYGQGNGDMNIGLVNGSANPHLAQPKPVSPVQLQRPTPQSANSNGTNNFLQNFDWSSNAAGNQFQDMHHLHPNYMFNTSEVTNEYNLLNDFLSSSLLDDNTGLYSNDDAQALFNDPLLSTSSMNALTANSLPPPTSSSSSNRPNPIQQLQAQSAAGIELSRPSSTFPPTGIDSKARDKFYMTAADPAGLDSASNRLHALLKSKWDAGMLKPFNYVKGYSRLSQYISKHLTRESQLRILKQLDRFRPKFREAMQGLTDVQLVLVEMWFERSLMEYDRVFASMAVPACCWRRTGEVFRGNTEMADLLRVPLEKLRDGRLAIHEIVAEDSLVSYWEKFGAIAFDQSQKAILTSCALKRPVERAKSPVKGDAGEKERGEKKQVPMETVRCCFSFTIRRDGHNIPSLIVGNFLPITPRRQSS
ncbi:Zinc cluster transcription factor acuM [Fulvia fulva]|uniref:Zinc cluster transcription factor acuM n=1 Tax=Passalora fulva TaxID=5499 RepID=A0A9Q8PMA8_PASFU|nr:Zinc cluster transcription factor acuM [Fulvia fulva]UJO25048.1 Zinc cluster transcription factor acuM [Fulvia fulva]WPV22503.1 Zinc cluster transcription factor acuM [Fulvia fulva]